MADTKESIAGVATSVVGGLKESPLLLGVIVLNLLLVGGLIYVVLEAAKANTARFDTLMNRCLPGKAWLEMPTILPAKTEEHPQ